MLQKVVCGVGSLCLLTLAGFSTELVRPNSVLAQAGCRIESICNPDFCGMVRICCNANGICTVTPI
jgi:hypothetical protein